MLSENSLDYVLHDICWFNNFYNKCWFYTCYNVSIWPSYFEKCKSRPLKLFDSINIVIIFVAIRIWMMWRLTWSSFCKLLPLIWVIWGWGCTKESSSFGGKKDSSLREKRINDCKRKSRCQIWWPNRNIITSITSIDFLSCHVSGFNILQYFLKYNFFEWALLIIN